MCDAETIGTIDTQRKSRSSFMGVVTRSFNLAKAMRDDDPASYDIENLEDRLESLKATEHLCTRAMDAICDEEEDEDRIARDEAVREKFTTNVRTVRALFKRFISLKTAHGLSVAFQYKLENTEATISRAPAQDHSKAVERLTTALSKLETVLLDSTIDPGHALQQEVRDYDARLTDLTKKKAPLPPSIISDRSSSSRSEPEDQACKLPKIELPHFHGNRILGTI